MTASGPKSDLADFYAFVSYEQGRSQYTTFIATINGLQETQAGPNYSPIASDYVYNIHVENTGDAVEDLTFQFIAGARYSGSPDPKKGTGAGLAIPVPRRTGTTMVKVALSHIGQVLNTTGSWDESALNYKEHYLLRVFTGPSGKSTNVDAGPFATNMTGGTEFRIPYSNAGTKSIPFYDAYSASFQYGVNFPGCATPGRVFVGQRQEGFVISLGEVFDLVNLDPTAPGQDPAKNSLVRKSITAFVIEVPNSCIRGAGNGVIGAWASVQHLGHVGASHQHVAGAQKNRLGNPLINELFIGLTDKDQWNAAHPRNDINYLTYLQYPTLPEILDILFGKGDSQPSIAPTFYPRIDLSTVLYQGVPNVPILSYTTQQSFVSSTCGTVIAPPMADMLRLNLNIAPTARGSQSPFGILSGSDLAGFPNGRRPGDDVVDIYLRVGMGALCWTPFDALLGICNSTQALVGNVALTDHAPVSDQNFSATFPYLLSPSPGNQDRCP
jgi:hypothetical protein